MVARSPTPHILIADSEPTSCRVFEAKLTRHHPFQVVSVTSVSSALQCVVQDTFDLILWDMRLLDSVNQLPRVRALCPDAALLLMTTDDRPKLHPDYSLLDVCDTLIKPFNLETMVEKVQYALKEPCVNASHTHIELARVGQQICLRFENGVCNTRVLEYRQDSIVVVGSPRIEAPEGIRPGLRVEAFIQGQDARYRFRTRILRLLSHPVPCWELQKPRVIQREQRRRHPRVSLRLPVNVEGLTAVPKTGRANVSGSGRRRKREGDERAVVNYTEDVSLGGFALRCDHSLPVGTEVDFVFRAGEAESLFGRGRIVRVEPVVEAFPVPESRYHLALQFTELESSSRRMLSRLLNPSDSLPPSASSGEKQENR